MKLYSTWYCICGGGGRGGVQPANSHQHLYSDDGLLFLTASTLTLRHVIICICADHFKARDIAEGADVSARCLSPGGGLCGGGGGGGGGRPGPGDGC